MELSAILLTFIKLPFAFKTVILSIFEFHCPCSLTKGVDPDDIISEEC